MAIISDNVIDLEVARTKVILEDLKKMQGIFKNSFQTMNPKERASMILKIQADHKKITAFLDKVKGEEINNSGTRFSIENIKQSFQSQINLWRKIEKSIENFINGSAPKIISQQPQDEKKKAFDTYMNALKNTGHTPSPEMVNQFKERFEAAYTKAKSVAGDREVAIQVIKDGTKIKIRMEPK